MRENRQHGLMRGDAVLTDGVPHSTFWREYLLGRTHFGAGEESRAKDAKDAKGRGMKDEEIAGVVVEGAFALRIQMPWR